MIHPRKAYSRHSEMVMASDRPLWDRLNEFASYQTLRPEPSLLQISKAANQTSEISRIRKLDRFKPEPEDSTEAAWLLVQIATILTLMMQSIN